MNFSGATRVRGIMKVMLALNARGAVKVIRALRFTQMVQSTRIGGTAFVCVVGHQDHTNLCS